MVKSGSRLLTAGFRGQQASLWLASDIGLFKKHGLNVERVLVRGGATRTAGISSGEIQFGVDSAVSPFTAAASGIDLVIVASYYNKHPWSFAVRPEIKTPQELVGKNRRSLPRRIEPYGRGYRLAPLGY